MSKNDTVSRGLWLAVILLGGGLAAVTGGLVVRVAGASLQQALGAAFAVFLGLATLGLSMRRFMTE
ncbi:hypothetical protein Q0Z83_050210 [Actinoplanes sichuanensis]|uniref:Uncharacterized protein n=1 Tax=Actinoplanes sichuanensis TaxID=512349 RepID=A0ABW4APL5_9ACTN|nr:hypothetical protein [Actinoplanes sichuanensis]BEL06830.1 hypothetical protein Q0Z83_050210 [Actinoplanes sichuanensis]